MKRKANPKPTRKLSSWQREREREREIGREREGERERERARNLIRARAFLSILFCTRLYIAPHAFASASQSDKNQNKNAETFTHVFPLFSPSFLLFPFNAFASVFTKFLLEILAH